jgi:hypothetical protein
VPWVALAFAVLLLAPRVPAAQETQGTGAPAPQAPAPAATPPPAEEDLDDDFEEERPRPSLALGPAARGKVVLSVDLGWIRSGVRADLGIARWIDLVLRLDTLLLYEGFRGPSSVNAGVRLTPVSDGLFRASIDLLVGQVFIPGEVVVSNLTAVRGDALAGAALPWATVYARIGVRGLSGGDSDAGWTRDSELGFGVERAFGRIIAGVEGFVWARPGLSGLGQWRLRVGYAL